MKINTIEEVLFAYKRHKELIKEVEEKRYDTTPDFENIGKVLNDLVEEIKETATINDIDTILKLIDIYKTTKAFWLKEVIANILNEGHCFNNKNCLQEEKMVELTEEFKEPITSSPFDPDILPNSPFDPNPTLPDSAPPDSKKLNTVWCENTPNSDTNNITTNVIMGVHDK